MSFTQPYFWARSLSRVTPHWTATVFTPPVQPVLTLDEVKQHCRIDLPDEERLIERYVATATRQVEEETGLKLLTQTWDLTTDASLSGVVELPFGPLQSVTHVKYTDTAGTLQTVTSSDYLVDASSSIGRVGLAESASWPTDLRAFQPITIRAVFGWTAIDLVPAPLVLAVALLVAHWHAHRGVVDASPLGTPLPFGYDRLIGLFVTRLVA